MNLNDEVTALRALRDAVDSGEDRTIARVAMDNVWPLYNAHLDDLLDVVERLPPRVLDRYPVLRVIHPMTPVLARTKRLYKPLVDAADAKTMSVDQLDMITLAQMITSRLSGDVSGAMVYARRLDDRIHRLDCESRRRTDGALWFYHQQIGATTLVAGDTPRALAQFATARQLGQLSLQEDAERLAFGYTALAHALRGSLDDAERALAEAADRIPYTASHGASGRAAERAAAALVAVERLTPDVEYCLDALPPYDSVELSWPFDLLARTRYLLAMHRPDEAIEAVRLARDSHSTQHGSAAADIISSEWIAALCAKGDSRSAWQLMESKRALGPLLQLAVVRMALHDSRLELAARELRVASSDNSGAPGQRAEIAVLEAWLLVLQTNHVDRQTAAHIHRLTRQGSIRRILATTPRLVIDKIRNALSETEAIEFDVALDDLIPPDLSPRPTLTRGELRVLNALQMHPTTAAIAIAFQVSPNTIKSQLKAVYRKLGCSSREQAINIASGHRLIGDDHTGDASAAREPWEGDRGVATH